MTNLEQVLRAKAKVGRKIVCVYLTLGYPSLSATEKLIIECSRIGVDVLELGFPFSDPMADGPTIQKASDFSLKHHVKFKMALSLVKKLRSRGIQIPILLFTYYNPVFHYGLARMANDLKKHGFQGVIIPDLPPQEGSECRRQLSKKDLSLVYLIAPTTNQERMKIISEASQGFIYYVSLKGVTGARRALDPHIEKQVKLLKRMTAKPVLVGFGVSTPEHVKTLCKFSDGIIVGSAVINQLSDSGQNVGRAVRFIETLVQAARSTP